MESNQLRHEKSENDIFVKVENEKMTLNRYRKVISRRRRKNVFWY